VPCLPAGCVQRQAAWAGGRSDRGAAGWNRWSPRTRSFTSSRTPATAAKIGITDADGSRLKKHSQQGWQILATVQVPGELALSIEKEILDWWRGELALPVHLGKPEMPHGGWTETVDSTEIDLAATIQRIKGLAAASH
jgi:hypothetical protein